MQLTYRRDALLKSSAGRLSRDEMRPAERCISAKWEIEYRVAVWRTPSAGMAPVNGQFASQAWCWQRHLLVVSRSAAIANN